MMGSTGQHTLRAVTLVVLLGLCAAGLAQEPPDEAPPAAEDAGGQALPCVPAAGADADGDTDPDGETGPDGEQREVPAGGVPCEPQDPEVAEPPGEQAPEDAEDAEVAEAVVEEDPDIRASADEVFEPGDEIPEDYPVPLPADI